MGTADELAALRRRIEFLEAEIECNRACYLMFSESLRLLFRDQPTPTRDGVIRSAMTLIPQCDHPQQSVRDAWKETIQQMSFHILQRGAEPKDVRRKGRLRDGGANDD